MSTDLRARLRTLQEAQARQERELDAATKAGGLNQRQKVLDEGRQELHQNQEVIEHYGAGRAQGRDPWWQDREPLDRAAGAESDDAATSPPRPARA